jgi:peroxiredoxin Q/BCP
MSEKSVSQNLDGVIIEIGKKAPAFSLISDTGQKVSLRDFLGKTVILYFYPKDMTSGCTQQACDFRDLHVPLNKKGCVVLGISKDSVASHVKFKTKYELPFTLLADPEVEVCRAYGVWKEKSMYGKKYMGVERSTFVIGPDQKVLQIFTKVKVKGHAEEILRSLG